MECYWSLFKVRLVALKVDPSVKVWSAIGSYLWLCIGDSLNMPL